MFIEKAILKSIYKKLDNEQLKLKEDERVYLKRLIAYRFKQVKIKELK